MNEVFGVWLSVIFVLEYGIGIDFDVCFGDMIDVCFNVVVYSFYGSSKDILCSVLVDIDVVVFDL